MTESTGANGKSRPQYVAQPKLVNYYHVLDLKPGCSSSDIRRAYWEKSKLFHPDTTVLAPEVATEKFQQLNQAYATLSSPEQRLKHDQQLQLHAQAAQTNAATDKSMPRKPLVFPNSGYLDPGERSLSSGELFALFILGFTFLTCLLLAVIVGWSRGELALKNFAQSWPHTLPTGNPQQVQVSPSPASPFPRRIAPPLTQPTFKTQKPPPVVSKARPLMPSPTPIHHLQHS